MYTRGEDPGPPSFSSNDLYNPMDGLKFDTTNPPSEDKLRAGLPRQDVKKNSNSDPPSTHIGGQQKNLHFSPFLKSIFHYNLDSD